MDLETAKETSKVFIQVSTKTREALKKAEQQRQQVKASTTDRDNWVQSSTSAVMQFIGEKARAFNIAHSDGRLKVSDLLKVLELALTHLKKASEK